MQLTDLFEIARRAMPVSAPLDPAFLPAVAVFSAYESGLTPDNSLEVTIAIERAEGHITSVRQRLYADEAEWGDINRFLIERLVKTLLWAYGGFRVVVGGPAYLAAHLRQVYAPGGTRDFDYHFIPKIYERPLQIEDCVDVPADVSGSRPVGRHLDGCRIGFDAGGSDRKVSAVVDGEVVFSEEVVWHPKTQPDPSYHYQGIVNSFKAAASHMPRVDAIGISSAGIYVANRTMVASLFIKVQEYEFEAKVKDIYLNAAREIGNVPLEVANDGDVTALAGAMDLEDNNVLGIAMGTSEAGGFVDGLGNITGWLNELAFVPVDFAPGAAIDEWSGDSGCGVKYFSQEAVAKLAPAANITLPSDLTPAEKLKAIQDGGEPTLPIFDTIGVYLGYTVAWYARFYEIRHVLILGRVTSGEGGTHILEHARKTLTAVNADLASNITLHLPDESSRRVGQSIAAASLPAIQ